METWSGAGADGGALWPLATLVPPKALGAESSLATCLCAAGFCAAAGMIVGSVWLAGLGELLKLNNFFMLRIRAAGIYLNRIATDQLLEYSQSK
jgi:hypothetical protein